MDGSVTGTLCDNGLCFLIDYSWSCIPWRSSILLGRSKPLMLVVFKFLYILPLLYLLSVVEDFHRLFICFNPGNLVCQWLSCWFIKGIYQEILLPSVSIPFEILDHLVLGSFMVYFNPSVGDSHGWSVHSWFILIFCWRFT